jgi:hypothetical protein
VLTIPEQPRDSWIRLTVPAWRILNSLILLAALFAPWEVVYADMALGTANEISGWQFIFIQVTLAAEATIALDWWWGYILQLAIGIGCLGFVIYAIVNFLQVVAQPEPQQNRNLRPLLYASLAMGALICLRVIFPVFLVALGWGFWQACAGLMSGVAVEVLDAARSGRYARRDAFEAA